MVFEKPKLFHYKKGFVLTMSVFVLVLLLRLLLCYSEYRAFIQKPFYYTYVSVLKSYIKTKNDRSYRVLKLKSDEGLRFYTTNHETEAFDAQRLRIKIFPNAKITFFDYMGTFYVSSQIKKRMTLPPDTKEKFVSSITSQHENPQMGMFYAAIFFATAIDKALRSKITTLGVSHLVALSGFHLGILWALVYGLLGVLYRPLQQRYFPYRYAMIDVGVLAMALLGYYLYFVDYPPSLIRSFAMVLIGWLVLLMGLELLSFTFLVTVILLLLALMPSLLVSLGFWLSVAGVFYIFLLLSYTQSWKNWLISLLVIPFGIFVLMLPVVHAIFGLTSSYQLLSPLLSILFVPFYPLSMGLHLLGIGDVLDGALAYLFSFEGSSEEKLLPLWMTGMYILLSFGAVRERSLFYLLIILASLYTGYLFLY